MSSETNVDGASESVESNNPGINALPGACEELWTKTPIGQPHEWPSALRTFTAFITTLPHPAAVYWGEELFIIHNAPWGDVVGSSAQQGKPQKEALPDEALSLVRTAMLGKTRRCLNAELFINNAAHSGTEYQALLSPVMDMEKPAAGAVIQLFAMSVNTEKRKMEKQGIMDQVHSILMSDGGNKGGNKNSFMGIAGRNGRDKRLFDELPLDENPFFQRFASMLPTGLAILNHKAEAVFVNEQFFELTTSIQQNFKSWPQSIHPDDYDRVMDAYQECFQGSGQTLRMEFRTQGQSDPWRLLLLTPLVDNNLNDKYIGFVCAVIDITPNKAQEFAQQRAAQEAVERKEQQERFIDMISHEIRNPLSAILHCAEDIMEIVESGQLNDLGGSNVPISALTESAETIKLCVSHQKNIVDDILSYSKLDASMLSLAPKTCEPKRQIGDTLKMFQPETKKQNMSLQYKIDYSYQDAGIEWVKADLVRISQVVVNLITNAIKFTAKKEGEKTITTMMGASLERPSSYPPNVVFFDTEDIGYRMDVSDQAVSQKYEMTQGRLKGTNTTEWGNGEAVYIMIAVTDTGIGISKEGQERLFQRFRQATPKTEEVYGGSGLGLSIARKLCQLHGGEIGVSSIEGVGSTFGFFFKVRRVDSQRGILPEQDVLQRQDLRDGIQLAAKGDAPIEDLPEELAAENLRSPSVGHLDEVGNVAAKDAKWQNTAEIASHVEAQPSDEYQVNRRPSGPSKSNSSGVEVPTRLQMFQRRTDSDIAERNAASDTAPEKDIAHVLLVEDNIINQRILKRKLESKKFKVTTANNGREAVATVQKIGRDAQNAYDIILMDQEMPILDGNAATKEIRELEKKGEVIRMPVLGVTANVRGEQKSDMVNAGMDDVISKPYSMEELVGKITRMVLKARREKG